MQKEEIDPRFKSKVSEIEIALKKHTGLSDAIINGICVFALGMFVASDQCVYYHDMNPGATVTASSVVKLSDGILLAILIDESNEFTPARLAEEMDIIIRKNIEGANADFSEAKLLVCDKQ